MSKTLIVGDVHLGRSLSLGRPGFGTALNTRIIDQIELLDWIYDQAIDNGVQTLIFTGDIYEDAKPDYVLVKFLLLFLKRCEDSRIKVIIIPGNHDIKRTGTHYVSILDLIEAQESEYVHIYKQINTIYEDGVCFTLLPFRDRKSLGCTTHDEAIAKLAERLPFELADIPTHFDKVLIGHLALEGSIFVGDEIDDLANELMCPLSLFKGYDYVWMGHVHKPQVRSKNPYIAHIGSLDISDFGETDHQKILVLYDPKMPGKFKEIKVPSRPLRKINLSVPLNEETTEYLLKEIANYHKLNSLKDAIVRLEVKLEGLESKNSQRDVIEKFIYECGAQYICSFSESRNVSVVPLTKKTEMVDNSVSPNAAVKKFADIIKFNSEDDKQSYITKSLEIIKKLSVSVK